MKFFQKTWVAVALTAAMIVGAVFIGLGKTQPDPAIPTPDSPRSVGLDTTLSTGAYEKWVGDFADVLSPEQERQICLYNANWDKRYGSLIVVETLTEVPGGGLEEYTHKQAEKFELAEYDGYLALVPSAGDAYLAVGMEYPLSDSQVGVYMNQYLYDDLNAGRCGQGVLNLFGQLNQYYLDNFGPYTDEVYDEPTGGDTIFGVIALLVLLLVIASIVDSMRYKTYHRRYYGVTNPTVVYRPLLFWHGPGYGWYRRRWNRPPPPRPPHGPGPGPRPPHGPGGFGGGSSRPTGGFGSGNRPNRPSGGFGGSGFSGGSGFGGSRGGSSGGFRGGGFSGSRGGGFSGGSRGGGFSGGSRGGGFSGGSRGGGFGRR